MPARSPSSPSIPAPRRDLAIGIAGDPELLFLDEPTTGFDPAARRRSWELIRRLRSLGKTILLTTHYIEEAQRLADRVVVIGSGRVIATGTPDDLARERPTVISFRVPAPGIPLPQAPQQGETVTWGDLAVLAVWTLVGARVAVHRFRWDPVAPGSRGRQREPDVSPATG